MTGCCAGVRRPRAGDRVGACGIRRTCRERVGLGGESWVTGRCTGVRRPLAGDRAGVCSIQGDSQNIPGGRASQDIILTYAMNIRKAYLGEDIRDEEGRGQGM